jgi:hypothetical protein
MSFSQTKTALIEAIRLPDTPVIALHGHWGTGKTHLWRELVPQLEKEEKIPSLYVSCMAYSSIAALKSAIIALLLSRSQGITKHSEWVFKIFTNYLNKKLPDELRLSTSLSDFQFFLPQLKSIFPKNTIIALDDIERATELNIRELLGFIHFLVEELNLRILLILNKEKLGNNLATWEQLREKTISIEIALRTKPDDCISIGLGDMPAPQLNNFAERIRQLGTTNIRTIQRMRRTYNAIAAAQPFDNECWSQLIPSIALFVALHCSVLELKITIEQALNPFAFIGEDSKKLTEDEKKASHFLSKYGVYPDRFEIDILAPYLRTGFLDKEALADYAKELEERRYKANVHKDLSTLNSHYLWDIEQPNSDLITKIQQLRLHVAVLDGNQATWLANISRELGDNDMAEGIIHDWLEAHKSESSNLFIGNHDFELGHLIRDFHPSIQALYREKHAQQFPAFPLQDAIEYLSSHSSWGKQHSHAVENATREQIEQLLRTSLPDSRSALFNFFAKHLNGRSINSPFQSAAIHFADICISIVSKERDSRLATIIRRRFDELGIKSLLDASSA